MNQILYGIKHTDKQEGIIVETQTKRRTKMLENSAGVILGKN